MQQQIDILSDALAAVVSYFNCHGSDMKMREMVMIAQKHENPSVAGLRRVLQQVQDHFTQHGERREDVLEALCLTRPDLPEGTERVGSPEELAPFMKGEREQLLLGDMTDQQLALALRTKDLDQDYTDAASQRILWLSHQYEQANANGWESFNAIQAVNEHLIESDVLEINHEGLGEAVGQNLVDTIKTIEAGLAKAHALLQRTSPELKEVVGHLNPNPTTRELLEQLSSMATLIEARY